MIQKNRLLDKRELEAVSDMYRVKIFNQIPMADGNSSNVVAVHTSQGDYVVKHYPVRYGQDLALFQAEVSEHLRGSSVPTPKIKPDENGALVSDLNGRPCLVMEYMSGKYPTQDDPRVLEYVFGGLAMALNALRTFQPEKVYQHPRFSIPLRKQLGTLKTHLPAEPRNDVDAYVMGYVERLARRTEEIEERMEGINQSPDLILGDYNLESLLVVPPNISAIIDFDHVHKRLRAFDVVHSIDLQAIDKLTPDVELYNRIDWEILEACMKIYVAQDPDIVTQIPLFPLMLQFNGAGNVIKTWVSGYDQDASQKQKDYFDRRVKFFVHRLEAATQFEDEMIVRLQKAAR